MFAMVYASLYVYYQKSIGKHLFITGSNQVNEVLDFIERQRRSIIELSRSEYIHKIIEFSTVPKDLIKESIAYMESFIASYQKAFDYQELFLIDRNGQFLFATKHELIGKNIKRENLVHKEALIVFDRMNMTLTPDVSPFLTLFTEHEMSDSNDRAVYISAPVLFDEMLIGFLVVRINIDRIRHIIKDSKYAIPTATYVVAQYDDNRLHYIVVDERLASNKMQIVERAVRGLQGYAYDKGDHNQPVALAWHYIPQLNWGFVIQVDYDTQTFWLPIIRFLLIMVVLALLLCILHLALIGRSYSPSLKTTGFSP